MHDCVISIVFDNIEERELFSNVLKPEVENFGTDRCTFGFEEDKTELKCFLRADDIFALRALTNSLFRLLTVTSKVLTV